ncbi:MAG TPA: GNAT family N-acetyltransferase [Bacteroidales bacterium]|nr:GNAT family N-acetyltransferase [Bacteroidales bacterium]
MLNYRLCNNENDFNLTSINETVKFLHQHLEQFGDNPKDITKCIDYALQKDGGKGGFVMQAYYNGQLAGVLIMNKTGMSGFIPENILVYIAVDSKHRGKGFGAEMIKEAIKHTKGNIKLHVEYENPAKRLYERLGFTSKYAEMRFENIK